MEGGRHGALIFINDLVDIVSSDVNKKNIIFENTKRVANTILYEGILKELNQRASDRGGILHVR